MKQRLPNLFIIAAPKCGTTSLHAWLAEHPDVLGSTPKEANYFVDADSYHYSADKNILNGWDGYQQFFQLKSGDAEPKVILESTPVYLYSQTAFDILPDLSTNPHFIVMVREPAAQIHSIYNYYREHYHWIPFDMTFADYVETARREDGDFRGSSTARYALRNARYVDHIKKWEARVGRNRIHVFTFDELVTDPRGLTKRIAATFGLDPSFYDNFEFPQENPTRKVRLVWLQKINFMTRPYLPRGRLHSFAKNLYNRLNYRMQDAPDQLRQSQLAALRLEFVESNAELAARYNLDISRWQD